MLHASRPKEGLLLLVQRSYRVAGSVCFAVCMMLDEIKLTLIVSSAFETLLSKPSLAAVLLDSMLLSSEISLRRACKCSQQ